ncbi:MAG: methyltransferase domain-containing protein [bacterium]|nr:methyltransferase domain-containing protein [bacterium]
MGFVYQCPRDYFAFWHIAARLGVGPVRRFLERARRGCGPAPILLDVGTGAGSNSLLAARAGYRVLSCDLSHASLRELGRVARHVGIGDGLLPVRSQGGRLPLSDGSCDVVLASHIIEHLEDPKRFLVELARVLRPGGILRISCPSRFHALRISRWLGANLDPADHRVLGYSGEELADLLPKGLRIARTTHQGRFLESNLADAQQVVSRMLGIRANPVGDAEAVEEGKRRVGLAPYVLKEVVLLPAIAACIVENALLVFMPGSMITVEAVRAD